MTAMNKAKGARNTVGFSIKNLEAVSRRAIPTLIFSLAQNRTSKQIKKMTKKIIPPTMDSATKSRIARARIRTAPSPSIVQNMQVGNLTIKHRNATASTTESAIMPIMTGIPGFRFYTSKVSISLVGVLGFVVAVVVLVANFVLKLLKSALARKNAPAPIINKVSRINSTQQHLS